MLTFTVIFRSGLLYEGFPGLFLWLHAANICWIFFFNKFIYLFIYFWLCWVFVSVRGLSLVAASGGHYSSRCAGLSLSRPLLLWSTGSRRAGSVVVAHGPSCSTACGIFPDQGSNPCPLHWQADSQPLRHQGSPNVFFVKISFWYGPFWKSLLNLLQYCFCFMFWFFGPEACGILAPQPGIQPTPSALEG